MTTPAHKLFEKLSICTLYDLRTEHGTLVEKVTFAHALGLAERGLIEGVGPKSGTVKYLRYVCPEAVESSEIAAPEKEQAPRDSHSPLNAKTNLGAYRQSLENGTVWALCLLRNRGF
jgi:hypothetical protein